MLLVEWKMVGERRSCCLVAGGAVDGGGAEARV